MSSTRNSLVTLGLVAAVGTGIAVAIAYKQRQQANGNLPPPAPAAHPVLARANGQMIATGEQVQQEKIMNSFSV